MIIQIQKYFITQLIMNLEKEACRMNLLKQMNHHGILGEIKNQGHKLSLKTLKQIGLAKNMDKILSPLKMCDSSGNLILVCVYYDMKHVYDVKMMVQI